jgi:TetR/AcrR family transcriptional repressor of mexCD-oprJ operon
VAAAAELVATGSDASMSEVAAAAGMARATVYRYFPTRQALLDRVAEVAAADVGARLHDARLDSVSADEGVVRAVRAFFDVRHYFAVLAGSRVPADDAPREKLIEEPLRQMFARGQKNGEFRSDLPVEWLAASLVNIVASVVSTLPARGRDDTVDLVSGLFLEGVRAPQATRADLLSPKAR